MRGAGFSLAVPPGWSVRRAQRSVAAKRDGALVSVTVFTLQKRYDSALFGRAARELDGVAAKLAAEQGAKLTERMTTTVAGRRIRAYRFGTAKLETRIAFVLVGKREYQLLCETPAGRADPGGACALLFSSFSLA